MWWRCIGPCKRDGLPCDEIQVVTKAEERMGYCLTCRDALAAQDSTEAAGMLALEARQKAAAGGIHTLGCVSCEQQYQRQDMRQDFGDAPNGVPYLRGFCKWCLSEADMAWIHQQSSLPRTPPHYTHLMAG